MKLRAVSLKIYDSISQYFAEQLPQYELQEVIPRSDHPDDSHLYMVIAKHKNYPDIKASFGGGPWACWTCWNDKTKSLNFGHYDLKSYDMAFDVCMEFYKG